MIALEREQLVLYSGRGAVGDQKKKKNHIFGSPFMVCLLWLRSAVASAGAVQVVTQAAAEPFVIVTGNEEDSSDYEGIVMLFLQVRE